MKRLMVFALPLLLWSAAASAQQQQPQQQPQQQQTYKEKVDVNVVLLDAIVTDKKGNQILGLDKNDFVVTENGVEQPLDSVDYFTNRQLLDSKEAAAPFKVERVQQARYFVFFFDKPAGGELWQYVANARSATKNFIDKQMKPGDLVAIVAHDVRLKVFTDFTADRTKLAGALDQVTQFGKGVFSSAAPAEGPSILRSVDQGAMMSGSGTVYEGLQVLGDALRPIAARKNLIVFSPGILEQGQEVRDGMVLGESRYFKPMIDSLNSANVTVYAMNLLRSNSSDMPAVHQALERMTVETGGEYYRHPVSFEPLLKKIEQTNSGYYLLNYRTHHPQSASGFQHVDVKIRNHPELRVKARAGYSFGF